MSLCSSKGTRVVLYSICIVFAGCFVFLYVPFVVQPYSRWKNIHAALIMLGFPVCSLLHPEMKRMQMSGSWMQKFRWSALGRKEGQIRSELVPSDLSFLWLITAEHPLQNVPVVISGPVCTQPNGWVSCTAPFSACFFTFVLLNATCFLVSSSTFVCSEITAVFVSFATLLLKSTLSFRWRTLECFRKKNLLLTYISYFNELLINHATLVSWSRLFYMNRSCVGLAQRQLALCYVFRWYTAET